ncbi:acyl-CoA dehydrogenase [Pontibacillus halophilus JSM 076056 = DSM 19796]|uniref:Acyl-CoA dehydrogenase n=1 Tax=Pontibacillus halophilus JSM 076056 = DSM 19796 TaxID=1385510 RepID=A0A0A5GRI3_9BACI|nr:acyl-CoA dehydrogenase [Pontibacillus halophilus]KGX93858.1 acyl-CoA dehydrogenase [Pontibacillus halophilus JSM 076056 = DSM 19796]
MKLTFTNEQEMIRNMVRNFAQHVVEPAVEQMEVEDRFPREVVRQMGELGLLGIPIPEKYGGAGMDFTSYIIAIHELSKVSAAVGVILSVHTSVGTNPILYFGSEEQKERYIPKLAKGEYIGAFALTEPSAGSDAGSLKTRAVKEGDEYVLTGSKVYITNGGEADTYIVFARTDPEAGTRGISAFIVEKDTKGFEIGNRERKMGMHGSSTVQLSFDQCRVPASQLLGNEGDGFKIAMANLDNGRIGIAAQSLGIAEASLEHAVRYAKGREQFGKPISSQQGILFKLADMGTEVEAAKLLTYQAASRLDEGLPTGKVASMAKLFASRTAVACAIEAVQVHGGYGYTKDYAVERFFRDAKVCEIYEGTNEIQHIVISNHLIKE